MNGIMSFSSEIKSMICRSEYICPGCMRAELAGFFVFPAKLSADAEHYNCSGAGVAERIAGALSEELGIAVATDGRKLVFAREAARVVSSLSDDVIINDCCAASYVRGAFLASGSVSDPEKEYHLEFVTASFEEARFLIALLEKYGFTPRGTRRRGRRVVYLKESSQIAELIGHMSGGRAGLEIFSAQIEKELKNSAQRRVNCDSANLAKQSRASARQISAVRRLKRAGKWDALSPALREMGELRLENPDMSIEELGTLLDPPIGKSGVNHRLKRIMEYSDKL